MGQPEAQLNLAIMYANGKGVGENYTYAHAWASLASANGETKAKALIDFLAPQLTPTSLRNSSDIQAQYNQTTLNARLLPHFLKGRDYADRDPVRPWKPYIPAYPAQAQRRGVEGVVYVEFVVAADGHPRIPRIQVSLAQYLLRGKPGREAIAGALEWLERAVKQGNSSGKLLLSAILAASPLSDLRDPKRALALTDQLEHEYRGDPSLWEIRAAASASSGDLKAAVKAQNHAIKEAKDLGRDLAKLQQRESAYASGQAWRRDLLKF